MKEKCPICGKGELSQYEKLVTYKYKGDVLEVKQPGLWCDKCPEGILSAEDLKHTAAQRQAQIRRVDSE